MATNKLSTSLQKTHDKLKGFVGSGDEKSVKEVLGTLSTADKVKILCEPDRSHGFTLLHKAAMNDNMAVVRSMVASLPAADLHKILTAQNKVNETAVHAAAYKGFEDVVKCMLEQLPQPDLFKTLKVLDKHGYTAVFGAAKRGYVNVARCIRQLVAKADWAKLLMLKNNQSKTIIYWAAQEGNTELVKFLVETISDEDYVKLMTVKNSYGQSPIFRAASNGKLDTLKCLIDRVSGSELYRLLIDKSLEGLTPLHMAASSGLVDGIRELLGKLDPADRIEALNVKNKQGQTAKEMAVQEKQKEAAAILDEIKKQANNEIYGSAQRPKAVTTKSTSETEKSPASVTGSHLVTGISHKVVSSDSGVSSSETDSIPISREIARSATEATATMGDQGLADVLQEVEMGERLGSGGQATVYGGTWLGTPVAIKVLPDSEGFDLSAASMEQVEEYNAIKTLRHPNVVQFYGIAKLDNRIGLVMELCDTDLSSLAKANKTPKSDLLKIVKNAVCGLVYLHSKDMIHMDIKPHNILVQSGKGKLADLGLADLAENFVDMAVTAHAWQGTPLYRAPELLHRSAPSKAADMWSMGLTTLEVMTGERPYKEMSKYKKSFVPKGLVDGKLPDILDTKRLSNNDTLFKLVLNFDPEKRFSAADWLKKLSGYKL